MSQAIKDALKKRSKGADKAHAEQTERVRLVKGNLRDTAKYKELEEKELQDKFLKDATKDRHERALDELTDAIYKEMKATGYQGDDSVADVIVPTLTPLQSFVSPIARPSSSARSRLSPDAVAFTPQFPFLPKTPAVGKTSTKKTLFSPLHEARLTWDDEPPVNPRTGRIDRRTKEYKEWESRQ